MEKKLFSDIAVGGTEEITVLVISVQEATTKTGKTYCKFILCDGKSKENAHMWDVGKEAAGKWEKKVVKVCLTAEDYRGKISYGVKKILPPPDDSVVTDFIMTSPFPPTWYYEDILLSLREQIPKTDHPDMVTIVENIYAAYKDKLLTWAAAENVHHAFYGGLLYHTDRMVKAAIALYPTYNELVDKEVLSAGTALHDVGKLLELATDEFGTAVYTKEGNLFGHALIGIEMVRAEAAKGDYDPDNLQNLEHMIASHHGNLEWGAICQPATPEAVLLHEIDMIDSRMEQVEESLKKVPAGGASEKVFGLGNVRIYKAPIKQETENWVLPKTA